MIIGGTGHRPNKLGGYGREVYSRLISLAEYALLKGPDVDEVGSGMALGWDQALARAALNLGMPVKAYIPFIGMESKWPAESQREYHAILNLIPEENWIICSEGGYEPWKMQVRNERMVDASTIMLALWNGTPGGTANCIRYAEKKTKPVINLWNKWNVN